jgi:hypothetical protein
MAKSTAIGGRQSVHLHVVSGLFEDREDARRARSQMLELIQVRRARLSLTANRESAQREVPWTNDEPRAVAVPRPAGAAAEFDARLTTSDVPITDVAAQATSTDAILTCQGDNFDATLIAAVPSTSEDHRHIQLRLRSHRRRQRGIAVCNMPDIIDVAQ